LRTYEHWITVGKFLALYNKSIELTLLGSQDAKIQSQEITHSLQDFIKVNNLLGSTDLSACRSEINSQAIFICADGGLMHLCASLGPARTQMLALFSANVSPTWRPPQDLRACTLQFTSHNVSAITPKQIFKKLKPVLAH
jgi:ADP-heptose:LPS heptosyltransferase